MKKILVGLILGIVIGIFGELLIPRSYQYGDSGCFKDGDLYYINMIYLYSTKQKDNGKFIHYGPSGGVIPSYKVLWGFLSKKVVKLSTEECNNMLDQHWDFN
jgi:hypothetical protein